MTAEAISFPLDQNLDAATLTYRPWGTRSLKLVVSASSPTPALRIRPSAIRQSEVQSGIFRAYADDSDAFVVSWGGGHEPGPCLKSKDVLKAFETCTEMEPGDKSVIFFNVTHTGPDIPDAATVTIEAYNEDNKAVFASLPVRLEKPADYPETAVKIAANAPGQWQPQGDILPTYDPRWWPEEFSYVPTGELPLAIVRQDTTLSIQWQGKEVATITDDTKPTILDNRGVMFDLFQFDEWHVALRAWFFWLDANVGGGFFIGRHEVPDAERFDMLIRRADGRVTLACTDLHWREVWGEIEGAPMRATLGLGREAKLKLAKEEMGKLFDFREDDDHDDDSEVNNPNADWIPRIAKMHGMMLTPKKKGTEAHLPMIHNLTQSNPDKFNSSDVRRG
ncbi:MAG: hypothetical protein GY803_09660 [Chloroflexi bacterium]|nr:hypothetical protein [Chloroflexota bacterium]